MPAFAEGSAIQSQVSRGSAAESQSQAASVHIARVRNGCYQGSVRFRAESLRLASAQERFPYRERHVTLLRLCGDGEVTQAKGIGEKRAMLAELQTDDLLLAAWTGNYSTDIFVMDDLVALRGSLD